MADDQENAGDQGRPKTPSTIYETDKMDAATIAATNKTYAAMGLDVVVIDVSQFTAKNDLQPDGTYKRTKMRKSRGRTNETGPGKEQPES